VVHHVALSVRSSVNFSFISSSSDANRPCPSIVRGRGGAPQQPPYLTLTRLHHQHYWAGPRSGVTQSRPHATGCRRNLSIFKHGPLTKIHSNFQSFEASKNYIEGIKITCIYSSRTKSKFLAPHILVDNIKLFNQKKNQ
jgi:hypothetical protein